MATKVPHFLQIGASNSKIGVNLPDFYTDIGPVVGVSKLAANDTLDLASTVGALISKGTAAHVYIRYDTGTQIKTGKILCDIDKVSTALPQLIGKQYNGGTIRSASFRRRRRLK